ALVEDAIGKLTNLQEDQDPVEEDHLYMIEYGEDQENVLCKTSFLGGCLMVWTGISSDAHTDLVFIENGSLTDVRYIEETLEQYAILYAPFTGEN
ncbi:hypothetical protein BDFB_003119, partial [Asbolus verrucosus]